MQRFRVVVCYFRVAHPAGLQVIGGPFIQARMGLGLINGFVIAAVAGSAAPFQVHIFAEQFLVDKKAFVKFFRLDRRRRSRSPLALARGDLGRLAELLEDAFACVARDAAALHGSRRVPRCVHIDN